MIRKIMLLVFSGILMFNLSGCLLLLAGVAGGAGTAVWLSGKLTQEFHAPYRKTVGAAKSALRGLHLPVIKETQEEEMTQLKSRYTDGREMWIDIRQVTEGSSEVEIRVGGVSADKEAASIVLKKIQAYL